MFVGRETELNFLNSHYQAGESRILVLYGRGGLGKTALLRHFTQDKPSSYYLGRSCSEKEQRYLWGRELAQKGAEISGDPSFQELWMASLDGNKRVLVIDEFHFFVKADSSFFSELIQFVKDFQASQPLLVILCTSATGWVENAMITKIGRSALSLAGVWKMREMKFTEMRTLFPDYSLQAAVAMFGMLGGNPGLWKHFSETEALEQNMKRVILSEQGSLRREAQGWISEELRETAVYHTILTCLASGIMKLNDLHQHTGFSRAKISVYLKNLMELDLVEKLSSYETPGYANSLKGIYRISHPFAEFYFRVIFPNLCALEEKGPDEFYHAFVAGELAYFEENAYGRICKEYLSRFGSEQREWWGKQGRIPLLGYNDKGERFAAEFYYGKVPGLEEHQAFVKLLRQAKWKPDVILCCCEKAWEEEEGLFSAKEKIQMISVLE